MRSNFYSRVYVTGMVVSFIVGVMLLWFSVVQPAKGAITFIDDSPRIESYNLNGKWGYVPAGHGCDRGRGHHGHHRGGYGSGYGGFYGGIYEPYPGPYYGQNPWARPSAPPYGYGDPRPPRSGWTIRYTW